MTSIGTQNMRENIVLALALLYAAGVIFAPAHGELGDSVITEDELSAARGMDIAPMPNGTTDGSACSEPPVVKKKRRGTKNFLSEEASLWPGARVPYVVGPGLAGSRWKRAVLARAIDEIQDNTCVRFVAREEQDQAYLLVDQDSSRFSGCWAYIGYFPGEATMTHLDDGCHTVGTVVHELLHVLGADHEQNRPDRDEYVRVKWRNIPRGSRSQFFRRSWEGEDRKLPVCNARMRPRRLNRCKSGETSSDLGFGYDLKSIMHYGLKDFAKDVNRPTLEVLDPDGDVDLAEVGFAQTLSELDIAKLNAAYGCGDGGDNNP